MAQANSAPELCSSVACQLSALVGIGWGPLSPQPHQTVIANDQVPDNDCALMDLNTQGRNGDASVIGDLALGST